MDKVYKRIILTLEWFVGIVSVVYGAGYALIATFQSQGSQVYSEVLINPTITTLYCTGFFLSGLLIIAGIVFKQNFLAQQGLFINALARIFQVVSIWSINGFFQPSWTTTFLLVCLSASLWIGRSIKPVVIETHGP